MHNAKKYDDEKIRMDLIPPIPEKLIAEVLTYGAKKYGDRNWEKGLNYSRIYAATRRHLNAWWSGEDNDLEDGLNHLAHAAANILFLLEFVAKGTGKDDRLLEDSSKESDICSNSILATDEQVANNTLPETLRRANK